MSLMDKLKGADDAVLNGVKKIAEDLRVEIHVSLLIENASADISRVGTLQPEKISAVQAAIAYINDLK